MKEIATNITLTVSHVVEMMAALIIGISVLILAWNYIQALNARAKVFSKEEVRVQFGNTVAIALELLLGADVLATAIGPSWDDIGKLAAIAVIRTALNYFLGKELKHIKSSS